MADRRIWGALCTVLASVLSNYGINTQKRSLTRLEPGRDYWRCPEWRAGMLCVILGSAGDFAALALASPALVTALGGTAAMVCNLALARQMNRERVDRWGLAGLGLAVAGAVLISCLSPPLFRDLPQLREHLRNPAFVLWMCAQALGVPLLMRRRWPRAEVCLAVCSGVVGSFSVMFGSVVSLCLAQLIRGDGGVPPGYLLLPLALMVVCIVVQVHLLNRSLQRGDVMSIYPIFQTVWSGATAIDCVVLYGSSPLMLVGLGCMAGGIWCLQRHRSPERHYSVCDEPNTRCGETKT